MRASSPLQSPKGSYSTNEMMSIASIGQACFGWRRLFASLDNDRRRFKVTFG